MKDQTATPLTERKVIRRGLIAGLAGLGAAAMLKLNGSDRAQAASGDQLVLGNLNTFPGPPPGQVFEHGTRINYTTGTSSVFALDVRHGNLAINQALGGGHAIQGSNNNTSAAIFGRNHSTGPGVGAISASGPGVQGAAGLEGVRGIGTSNGVGVIGASNTGVLSTPDGSGNGIGVHGKSTGGPGVHGESINSLGVRGTSTNFVGVVGISTASHGLYGSSSSGVNGFGIVAENLGANGRGLLVTGNAQSQIFGGLQVFGTKNAVLKMQDGTFGSVYCQESPEPYFEDFGRAQLVGGVANVPLEREFASLVAGGDYMVTLTPEGPSWLYVSRRGPAGFEVREGNNGMSNVSFTYRIVTRRKDIEGKRFARVSTAAAEQVAGVRAMLAAMPAPGLVPTQPVVPPTTQVTVGPGLNVERPGTTP